MENKKEMTIPNVSAATDTEQSLSKCTDNSIVNQDTDFKGYEQSFEEMQREILRQLDPSYLKTVSMTTLYDTVFEVQTPLIDGLLQRGTYLFVGSPKVGKSFMMAQLAYHISTGTPLWEYKVRKATVLYFALEDDYPRLQKRLFQMFGAKETGNLYFATECKTVNGGLEEQIRGFMREHPDTGLIIIDTLTVKQEIKIYYKFIGFVDELHIIPTKRWAAMPAKNCTVCGVEYVPGSGASRYCPACAKKIRREKSNESKRRSREQKRIACMNCPQKMTD